MKQNTILFTIIALLVGGIAGYFIAHDADDYGMDGMMHERMEEHSDDYNDMPMGNGGGMDHSMMSVSSEREFLTGMIPHHQEAVDTAKEVIERGGSTPEIKSLAENIVIAQEKEIAAMKQWYFDWYGVEYQEKSEDYEPMMRELSGLSGAELDRRFLQDMIMHHMGAIMMAQSVQSHLEHQEVRDLTKAIVETQTNEIQVMKRLVSELN